MQVFGIKYGDVGLNAVGLEVFIRVYRCSIGL